MPKKTQSKVSNVRLRRSKTPKPPKPVEPELESDEEVIEISADDVENNISRGPYVSRGDTRALNEQEPEIESEPEELPIVEKPKPKPRKPRPSRAKPQPPIIDFKAEREAFNNYINEQRELLAKERAQHLESLKAEAKIERQSLTNTRDARLRLMSSLQL